MDSARGQLNRETTVKAIIGDIEPEVETPPVYPITFATMDDRMRNTCRHCKMYRLEHVEDHCLFDATMFEPMDWAMTLAETKKEIDEISVVLKKRKWR